ncbi:MarR family winged helix-turn-helix transcriptional regulator [Agromyces larvae]|uniref:MarR family winged helix-turn-helix transcriptional regulator n=1 Tax=Agromyces larvae TaxID=2929802 RepID=A0ABY4BZR5_9MICO|nr:MarR family winged helix-turn-helix transcriptional regulator [Agromyces larvae]UOE44738.1 MarR family winged helix-turn-helix transcriptional regulator [Agromyces larvae]
MTDQAVDAIELEAMLFARHLSAMPGRSRRRGGVLDQSAYTLLSLLEAAGPLSIPDLVAITGLDTSTLNRQTGAIVRDGRAERIADPDGGLARKFRLTRSGRAALDEERTASRANLAALTAEWTDGERTAFADLLGRLNRTIETRSGRSWPRADD